jgi:hypothetical protein
MMYIHVLTIIHVLYHQQSFSHPKVRRNKDLLHAMTTGRKLQDISAQLKDFQSQVPASNPDVETWTRFVRNNNTIYSSVFCMKKFREMTMNTEDYNFTQENVLEGFLKSLYQHPTLQVLVEPVKDDKGVWIYHFFYFFMVYEKREERVAQFVLRCLGHVAEEV